MRVMALDIGGKRVGLAVSDAAGKMASPLVVLSTHEVIPPSQTFRLLIDDWEIEQLVCGLPYSLSAKEGSQARLIRNQAYAISEALDLPCDFVDERLSSQEAKRILREEGLTEKEMRGKLDMIAASLFLQTWLDRQNAQTQSKEGEDGLS